MTMYKTAFARGNWKQAPLLLDRQAEIREKGKEAEKSAIFSLLPFGRCGRGDAGTASLFLGILPGRMTNGAAISRQEAFQKILKKFRIFVVEIFFCGIL